MTEAAFVVEVEEVCYKVGHRVQQNADMVMCADCTEVYGAVLNEGVDPVAALAVFRSDLWESRGDKD